MKIGTTVLFGLMSLSLWAAPQSTELQLKNAILNVQSQLGNIEPWQKKVFMDDVLPLYQRFIRDYRPSNNGLLVDVDRESIRRYIKYHPAKTDPRAMILLKVDPSCKKCVSSTEEVQAWIKDSMERREFVLSWVTPKDIASVATLGKEVDEKLISYAESKNIPVALSVQMRTAPIDNIDTAHADEEHYQFSTFLYIKDLTRSEGQMDLLSSDSFKLTAQRLLADALTDAGTKQEVKDQMQTGQEVDEILVEVTGIRSVATFSKLKKFMSERFKDVPSTLVEQRSASKTKVVFAISSQQTLDVIVGNLKGVYQMNPQSLSYVRSHDRTIEMEMK